MEELDDIDITVDELSTIPNTVLRIKLFDILDQIKSLNNLKN